MRFLNGELGLQAKQGVKALGGEGGIGGFSRDVFLQLSLDGFPQLPRGFRPIQLGVAFRCGALECPSSGSG